MGHAAISGGRNFGRESRWGLIFVPLTTLTFATIATEKLGNATPLFNLLRNIGSSVGVSMVTTILARRTQSNTAVLGANLHSASPMAMKMVAEAQGLFLSKGFDYASASRMSLASLFGIVQQQAWMLSFIAVARLFGILFIVVIPLLLIMQKPTPHGESMMTKSLIGQSTVITEPACQVKPKKETEILCISQQIEHLESKLEELQNAEQRE